MATVINTTNVALTELETAPGGATPSNFNFATSGRREWSVGIRGSGTFSLFTWGYGNGTGSTLNPIYGLTPPAGVGAPLELSDWRGLQYWFDGTPFDITLKYQNNNTPVIPPRADAIDVQMVITDDTGNFSIFDGTSPPNYAINFNAAAGQSQAQQQIPAFQADQYVLARYLYWYLEINGGPDYPGGSMDFSINGVGVATINLPGGPFFGLLANWTDAGSQAGETDASGCDLEFDIF